MSSLLHRGLDYDKDWTALGKMVWFDAPWGDGDRLYGEIVRTSSNPDHYHVEVNGERYEVSLNRDRMWRDREPL